MIRYVLRCDEGHKFEAWFRSKTDPERTVASGETTCPLCELAAFKSVTADLFANRPHGAIHH
jgi:hypothetical protein